MEFGAAYLLVAGIACGSWGWGRLLAKRLCPGKLENGILAAIGLAGIIFVGGVINVLGLAWAPMLWVLLAVGGINAMIQFRIIWLEGKAPVAVNWSQMFVGLALAGILMLYTARMAGSVQFNFHDDLEKYLVHPVRMLQTGSLLGSPVGTLGSETFGGQAFLQGFIISGLPLPWIHALDPVLGLGLLIWLLGSGSEGTRPRWMQFAVPLLVFALEPQVVNISSVYTGMALMVAALLVPFSGTNSASPAPPAAWLMALLYAALVALKSSFTVFVAMHLLGLAVGWMVASRLTLAVIISWLVRTAALAALFLSPWIVLHSPRYLAAFPWNRERTETVNVPFPDLLSNEPLLLGGSQLAFFGLFLGTLLAAAVTCGLRLKVAQSENRHKAAGCLAMLAVTIATYIGAYLLVGPVGYGYETHLRLALPMLIATAVIAVDRLAVIDVASAQRGRTTVAVLLMVAWVGLFLPSAGERIRARLLAGSDLSFIRNFSDDHVAARKRDSVYYLTGAFRTAIERAQASVPVGATLLAWTHGAYHLDFKRNYIVEVDPAGLATPWANTPDDAIILFEYRGPGVRLKRSYEMAIAHPLGGMDLLQARRCLELIQAIAEIRREGDVLYDDGRLIAFRRKANK